MAEYIDEKYQQFLEWNILVNDWKSLSYLTDYSNFFKKPVYEFQFGNYSPDSPYILIIGDSRTKGLFKLLKRLISVPFILCTATGLDSHKARIILEEKLKYGLFTHVLLLVGICDLTYLRNLQCYYEHENGQTEADLFDNLCSIVLDAEEKYSDISITIGGIYALNIYFYNQFLIWRNKLQIEIFEEDFTTQQEHLNSDVIRLNNKLHVWQQGRGIVECRLDNLVHKCHGSKNGNPMSQLSNSFSRLSDGCHPNIDLFRSVAKYVAKWCENVEIDFHAKCLGWKKSGLI